jgi:hypothetical protein
MGRRTSDVRPAQERTFLRPAALRQKQSIRSIETVKADTARKNWSISIAFSRWREDRWMHDPPKSPTSAWLWRFFSKDTQKTTAGSYLFGVLNSGPPETFRKPPE